MASRIHKRKSQNGYIVYFTNPILRISNQTGSFTDIDLALELCRSQDCEFYSEHPYMLPTGITLDKANRRFRVYTRYGNMKSHKTLMDAVSQKQDIINDLTESRFIKSGCNSLMVN